MTSEALVRASYAVSMLRLAHDVGLPNARRLIDALAAEAVMLNTNSSIIESEAGAIAAFKRLAKALQLGSEPNMLWQQAINAALAWENNARHQAQIAMDQDVRTAMVDEVGSNAELAGSLAGTATNSLGPELANQPIVGMQAAQTGLQTDA